MTDSEPKSFGLPSEMGELMATLLVVVDAWYALASEAAPGRFRPADRLEVLGLLVRLLARRFNGFRRPPRPHEVRATVKERGVGLVIRSTRALTDCEAIERQLGLYGFRVHAHGPAAEILIAADNLTGAQVLAFPPRSANAKQRRR